MTGVWTFRWEQNYCHSGIDIDRLFSAGRTTPSHYLRPANAEAATLRPTLRRHLIEANRVIFSIPRPRRAYFWKIELEQPSRTRYLS